MICFEKLSSLFELIPQQQQALIRLSFNEIAKLRVSVQLFTRSAQSIELNVLWPVNTFNNENDMLEFAFNYSSCGKN